MLWLKRFYTGPILLWPPPPNINCRVHHLPWSSLLKSAASRAAPHRVLSWYILPDFLLFLIGIIFQCSQQLPATFLRSSSHVSDGVIGFIYKWPLIKQQLCRSVQIPRYLNTSKLECQEGEKKVPFVLQINEVMGPILFLDKCICCHSKVSRETAHPV